MATKKGSALLNASRLAQAKAAAEVRFGPDEQSLLDLLTQATDEFQQGSTAQKATAEGIMSAIAAAQPRAAGAYGGAVGSLQGIQSQSAADMARLSSAADPYRASAAREAQAAGSRLVEASAGAQAGFEGQKVQAEEGRAYGLRTLMKQFQGNVGKVRGAQTSLAHQKGAFIDQTYGELTAAQIKAEDAAKKAAQDQAYKQALLTQGDQRIGISQQNADTSAAGVAARGQTAADTAARRAAKARFDKRQQYLASSGPTTYTQRTAFGGKVEQAYTLIPEGVKQTGSLADVRGFLLSGKNPTGKPFSREQVNAALDLYVNGKLGTVNANYYKIHKIPPPRPRKGHGNIASAYGQTGTSTIG